MYLSGGWQHEICLSAPIARKVTDTNSISGGVCFVAGQDIDMFCFMLVI